MSDANKKNASGALQARLFLLAIAASASVGAVVLLRFAFAGDASLLIRILEGAGGIVSALVAAFAWLVFLTTLTALRGNLFLYDRKTKTELPLDALTWELVRERLDFYFRIYLGGRRASPIPEPLRPLLMPYFFLTFLESAPDGDFERLLGGDKHMIDEMSDGVRILGADRAGDALQRAYGSYAGDPAASRQSLAPYRDEVEQALLAYIRAHIREFDR